MIVKKHKNLNGQLILAICDSNLLGQKFKEGKRQLDLTADFYKGEEVKEENLYDLIKRAYLINAVGSKTIEFLKKNNLVQEGHLITIANIPHVQICVVEG